MARLNQRQMREAIHRLITALPEAVELRKAAEGWAAAVRSPVNDAGGTVADAANRRLLSAAVDFTNAIRRAAVLR